MAQAVAQLGEVAVLIGDQDRQQRREDAQGRKRGRLQHQLCDEEQPQSLINFQIQSDNVATMTLDPDPAQKPGL